ncbi:MAG: dienelactone hydrolase-like enzyme [Chthonomonadaceae bacterium]|nr:dienelactone hydrolase-like enzyme [Chthonomonadaceae bacterium]
MNAATTIPIHERAIRIPWQDLWLDGNLMLPQSAHGIVLFAHGSGSSRHSPRNRYVAQILQEAGFATLLMDLLTHEEESLDEHTRQWRFDIDLLARRLLGATDWVQQQESLRLLPIGYFGASTGAAAALEAAAERPDLIRAVVSRGGRPDLAGNALPRVHAPTLLIVGGHDFAVISLNQQALEQIAAEESRMEIVPSATHLFEEPGTLEAVARLASDWFQRYLNPVQTTGG